MRSKYKKLKKPYLQWVIFGHVRTVVAVVISSRNSMRSATRPSPQKNPGVGDFVMSGEWFWELYENMGDSARRTSW